MSYSLKSIRLYVYKLMWTHIKETFEVHIAGFCKGNSPMTNEFPAQRASYSEKKLSCDDVVMSPTAP